MSRSKKKRWLLRISGILLALMMVLSNFTGLYPAMEAKAATCRIDVYTEGLEMGTVTGQGNYNSGDTVTLTAYPSPGYDFICWADYQLGEVYYENPLRFTATESREIDVVFKKQGEYFIYLPSHDEGAVNVNPLKSSYAPGETVYLSATTNTNYAVDTFLLREEGQEEYTEIGNSFTMPRNNVFVSARFRSTVPHTITIDPNMQHGTFTLLDGKTSYMQGETVRLSVNPEKGYRLTGISGIPAVYTYADGVFTFQMMGQDLMISGTFEKRTMFQVTVGVFPENGGTVDFNQTETGFLTMSAKANDGYVFAGYYDYTNQVKGKLLSKDVDYSKQLTEDVEILAVFDRVVSIKHSTYPLDVGTTTVAYDANKKQIVATVVPNEGYVFKYWFAVPSMEIIGREPTLYFDPGAYEQIAAYCKEPATSNLYLMSTENGTISVVNYKTTYLEGEEIEIAVTPDPGYVLENAYYGVLVDHTLKEAKYIVDNKFKMPGKDTWIYATFVRKSSYDVTATASLSEGGTVTGGGTYLPDETVTLTATANGGYEFINWTENGEEVSTSATYEFTATMDRVLVANFKEKEIVYENYFLEEFGPCLPEGWTFVNSDGDDYGWTYIWAPLYTGGHYAGSGEFALSSASMYGGRLLSADEWAITPAIIAPQNAKLSFLITEHIESYEPDNMSVYVGLSPEIDKMTKLADFSVRAGEMKRCEVNLAAYDGQKIYVGFRHYNSVGAIVLLLDDVEVSSGEAIMTDENLAITKRSLTLFDTITIDFKVPAEAVAAYHDPYLMVTQNGVETKLTDYREDGGLLIFSFRVAPHMMGDEVTAVPHAMNASGEDVKGVPMEYSVAKYCKNVLNNTNYQNAENAKLRRLLVDILLYGDAAQIYSGYKTDKLVSSFLTVEQRAMGTDVNAEMTYASVRKKNCATVENPLATIETAALFLEAAVDVQFKYEASDLAGLRVVVTDDEAGTNVLGEYPAKASQIDESGRYYVTFDYLNAAQMRKTVYATVMKGGDKVSNTFRYSIESYAYSMTGREGYESLGLLLDAMMRYGDSAAAYVKSMK